MLEDEINRKSMESVGLVFEELEEDQKNMGILRTKLRDCLDRFGLPYPTHILHVGVADGEEIPDYLDMGARVYGIEPHRESYAALKTKFGLEIAQGRLVLHNYALGCEERHDLSLRIIRTGDSFRGNTLLKFAPGAEKHHVTEIEGEEQVPVIPGWRHWLRTACHRSEDTVALVVDVQGMELQVLAGFNDYLLEVDYILAEVSRTPTYIGEASGQTVIEFLNVCWGFEKFWPEEIPEHDDLFFYKKRRG